MDVVTELREPVQTRSEMNLEEFGAGSPAQSAEEGQEEDDEFQRPRRVEFLDEQKHPVSREEREEHELLGHVQYRSWCRHCAAARGVGQQHRQLSEDPVDATVPEIVLDYYFMGEESETAPHIVVKDRKSSAYFSTNLDSKTSQYAVAFVAGAIQELGYKRILMKSDNAPAIKRLKERVSECLPGVECVPKETLVGDSRANGSAENAVKQVKGQFRTLKTSTEDRYRCTIDAKSCLLAWMPRLPWNLNGSLETERLDRPLVARPDAQGIPILPVPTGMPPLPPKIQERRMYVTSADVRKYGGSEGCQACTQVYAW